MFAHAFCKNAHGWHVFVNLMLIDFCESYADKENYTRGSRCIYVCDFQGIVLFT